MDDNLKNQQQAPVSSYQKPHPVFQGLDQQPPTKTFFTVIFSLLIVFVALVGVYLVFLLGSQLKQPQEIQTSVKRKAVPPVTTGSQATPTPASEEEAELQNLKLDDFEVDFLELENELGKL